MSKYKNYKTHTNLYPQKENYGNIDYVSNFLNSYSDNGFANINTINKSELLQQQLSDHQIEGWKDKEPYVNKDNPNYWGPKYWETLHIGSLHYPEVASPVFVEGMKGYILGLPYILPCDTCKNHAVDYIMKYKAQLNEICSGRDNLFKFFVDFHNYVNVKHNKAIVSYEEAKKLYS